MEGPGVGLGNSIGADRKPTKTELEAGRVFAEIVARSGTTAGALRLLGVAIDHADSDVREALIGLGESLRIRQAVEDGE